MSQARADRRRAARAKGGGAIDLDGLRAALVAARLPGGAPEVTERARRILLAWFDAAAAQGKTLSGIVEALASGEAATQIGQIDRTSQPEPGGLACARGCAFCCILPGKDGGTITPFEAARLHAALSPLAGEPDGTGWHADACPALDPETRECRAYDARPMICRSYVSKDVSACEQIARGTPASGTGTLGAYQTYLAAHALARAALQGLKPVRTHAMRRVAAAAVAGEALEASLTASRHPPSALEAERKRGSDGIARARLAPR